MKAMKWKSENIVAHRSRRQADVDDMLQAAARGEGVRILVEPWTSNRVLGSAAQAGGDYALFREGCIKAAEQEMWSMPQKGRVMAEIHRRLDEAIARGGNFRKRQERLASVFDFAGAWSLAAQLTRAGLRVCVIECGPAERGSFAAGDRPDIEIVLPAERSKETGRTADGDKAFAGGTTRAGAGRAPRRGESL